MAQPIPPLPSCSALTIPILQRVAQALALMLEGMSSHAPSAGMTGLHQDTILSLPKTAGANCHNSETPSCAVSALSSSKLTKLGLIWATISNTKLAQYPRLVIVSRSAQYCQSK